MRQIRFIILSCILLLCSFVTAPGNIFSQQINDSSNSPVDESFHKTNEYFFSGCSFQQNQPADITVNIVCSLTAQAVKNHSFEIALPKNSNANFTIKEQYLQYQAYSRYIDPALTSTKVIFPFHYFW